MKYRIVKITKGTKDHYEVQKRGVLWGWNTETYFDCCIDGSMAGDYPIEFRTLTDAETYIREQHTKTEIFLPKVNCNCNHNESCPECLL